MGKIEVLDFNRIVPTQSYLQEKNIKSFFKSYLEKPMDLIVPVRRLGNKDLLFDGHHSLTSLYVLGEEFGKKNYVWIAEHELDFIGSLPKNFHKTKKNIDSKNENINERFYYIHEFDLTKNLDDLRYKYDFMSNKNTLINFLKEEGVWRI